MSFELLGMPLGTSLLVDGLALWTITSTGKVSSKDPDDRVFGSLGEDGPAPRGPSPPYLGGWVSLEMVFPLPDSFGEIDLEGRLLGGDFGGADFRRGC